MVRRALPLLALIGAMVCSLVLPVAAQTEPTVAFDMCSPLSGQRRIDTHIVPLSEANPASAIWFSRCRGSQPYLKIAGPITARLADFIDRLAADLLRQMPIRRHIEQSERTLTVTLNSAGGNYDAAMRIGRRLRELNPLIEVSYRAQCRDACVLVLASGVERLPNSRDGVVAVRSIPRGLDDKVRDYLQAMNMPPLLFIILRGVPSDREEVLNRQQLESYGLFGTDPIYDARRTARIAAYLDITPSEYRFRVARAQQVCGTFDAAPDKGAWSTCTDAIHLGVSEAEFARIQEESDRCYEPFRGSDGVMFLPERDYQTVTLCQRRAALQRAVP
jgi:hypothetical protein